MVILPLPGTVTDFDRQQLAADLGPGQAGDHADLVLELGLAVAVFAHPGIVVEIVAADRHRLLLAADDLLDRLAGEVGDLALERAHAGLAGVVADQVDAGRRRRSPTRRP